jgi:hypothetical protein
MTGRPTLCRRGPGARQTTKLREPRAREQIVGDLCVTCVGRSVLRHGDRGVVGADRAVVPVSAEVRRAAASATNGAWPDALHRWFALHDGIVGHPYAVILPGFWPLPLDDVVATWRMSRDIAGRVEADEVESLRVRLAERDRLLATRRSPRWAQRAPAPVERYYDIASCERAPAGTVAGMFLPSFVPIGDNGSGCSLVLDLRSGPLSGCVTPYMREDVDNRGPGWPSLDALLDDIADCLETAQSMGRWRPFVSDGWLDWAIDYP